MPGPWQKPAMLCGLIELGGKRDRVWAKWLRPVQNPGLVFHSLLWYAPPFGPRGRCGRVEAGPTRQGNLENSSRPFAAKRLEINYGSFNCKRTDFLITGCIHSKDCFLNQAMICCKKQWDSREAKARGIWTQIGRLKGKPPAHFH